ncbi:MAG TPA: hypothetical protein ENH95_02865 [Nitrosopumilus sp.]|nr:hypothetical protein [Nitrosopumilus sp.]
MTEKRKNQVFVEKGMQAYLNAEHKSMAELDQIRFLIENPTKRPSDWLLDNTIKCDNCGWNQNQLYGGLVEKNAKELFDVIRKEPVGNSFPAIAKFLLNEFESTARAEQLADEMKDVFYKHGHSGGSACVVIQNLFDLLGHDTIPKKFKEKCYGGPDD